MIWRILEGVLWFGFLLVNAVVLAAIIISAHRPCLGRQAGSLSHLEDKPHVGQLATLNPQLLK